MTSLAWNEMKKERHDFPSPSTSIASRLNSPIQFLPLQIPGIGFAAWVGGPRLGAGLCEHQHDYGGHVLLPDCLKNISGAPGCTGSAPFGLDIFPMHLLPFFAATLPAVIITLIRFSLHTSTTVFCTAEQNIPMNVEAYEPCETLSLVEASCQVSIRLICI